MAWKVIFYSKVGNGDDNDGDFDDVNNDDADDSNDGDYDDGFNDDNIVNNGDAVDDGNDGGDNDI